MKKLISTLSLCLLVLQTFAQQEYKATIWGAKSDGVTDNTNTIQRAVDTISEQGGGTLVFYAGRYLTGAIQLKENVTLLLEEGAVLVASTNIYSYNGAPSLLWANSATNARLAGKGVLELRHTALKSNIDGQKAKGYLPKDYVIPNAFSGIIVDNEIKILEETAASTTYKK